MSTKEDILGKIRRNISETYNMPDLNEIKGTTYEDAVGMFARTTQNVGGQTVFMQPGESVDDIIRRCYPDAKVIASNLPEVTTATINPDTVDSANHLNGTDVAVVRGEFGVAENACVWVPQAMKEKAACFIAEYLVILLSKQQIVSNMHEAYDRLKPCSYGYGCFISGPSKTADIAQALVMGAQAARGVTVIITF